MAATEESIPGQLDAIRARLGSVERAMEDNTEKTIEVLDLLTTFKGGMKFLGWLGVGAKWIAAMVAAGAAIWTAIQAFLPHK